MARARSTPTWKTQSVLLRKTEYPTIALARQWLLTQRVSYRADHIEDSAIKPGGIPEGAGHFWRARQFTPHEGRMTRIVPLGKGRRARSIMLVRELQP
jgi:hypothetical protein